MNKRRSTRKKNAAYHTSNEDETAISIMSQNIVVQNVCEYSLLEQSIKVDLPQNLENIYQSMMSDLSFINNNQAAKDLNFYHCNMMFLDGEEEISRKRKEVFDLSQKLKKEIRQSKKRKVISQDSQNKIRKILNDSHKIIKDKCTHNIIEIDENITRKIRKFEDIRKPKKHLTEEYNAISEDLIEKINNVRANRKRKISPKLEKFQITSNVNEDGEMKMEPIEKAEQFIDLSSEDSKEDIPSPKKKIYFREPTQKSLATNNFKKLKEHTLLDKIMLGINCVRHWTDKGLHLTKLAENDLILLNKRLASVKCTMSDLEEHTDENNNKSLSLLIQSDIFSNQGSSVNHKLPNRVDTVPETNLNDIKTITGTSVSSNIIPDFNVTYNRHKSKQHISAMYRQRHNLPSILSKPTLSAQNRVTQSSSQIQASLPHFSSAVKAEENTSETVLPLPVNDSQQWDPSMSASQLLKLKSQRISASAATITSTASICTHTATAPPTPVIDPNPVPCHQSKIITTVNSFTCPRPPIYVQTIPRNKFVLPIFIPPQHTLLRLPQRTFRIPISGRIASEQPRFSSHQQSVPVTTVTNSNNNIGPQSTILKNLLQQSSHMTPANGRLKYPRSNMVPLSVFQNSNNQWQVGSIADLQFKK